MLTPLVGLILGIATLLYGVLAYTGSPLLKPIPGVWKQKGNLAWSIGCVLLAVALMLGVVGYFGYINAVRLRFLRIVIGTIGLVVVGFQLCTSWVSNYSFKGLILKASWQWQQVRHYWNLRYLLVTSKSVARKARYWLLLLNPWWAKFELLRTLVRRDLEARYKGSVLGNLWPLLNQLSQLLIYTYVFSIVLNVKLSLKGLPEDNSIVFGLWLFAGLLPWIAFTGGLIGAAGSVVGQPNLVKKVVFPLALLPLVAVLSTFIESAFGLAALIVLVAVSSGTLHGTLALLPLVWVPQLLLTAGLGYLAAGLTVFLRDIPQTLGVVLNLWFYMTPIVYPASVIPDTWRDWVFWLNPLAAIAEVYRDLVLAGEVNHWGEWGVASLGSLMAFYLGLSVYLRLRPAFADVL